MIKKSNLSIGVLLLVFSLVSCVSRGLIGYTVSRFKHSEVGRAFLKDNSEKDLEKVLAFIHDPVRNFPDVQRVADVCSYIEAYGRFISETNEDPVGYLNLTYAHFMIATDEIVPILTYLILNCHNAILSEGFADRYTRLFEGSPEIFIRDLKRRPNWKHVVDEVVGGDWQAFKKGLDKLGNAGFELELKNYVLSHYGNSREDLRKAALSPCAGGVPK